MAQKVIITIGRQYGSGGREIGRLVSQMLDIPFYDKELLAEAARTSGISQSLFERADEKGSGSLLYSMATGVYNLGGRMAPVNDLSIPDRLYLTQCNAMRQTGKIVLCQKMNKNVGFQKQKLEADGYTAFVDVRWPDEIEKL